jgi:Reverse transcriptase (RNA-dependent DNA polymerase)
MATELTALAHNSTWDLVPPPSNAHIIGVKWIFRLKLKAHGSVERHKGRLVAKGYSQ